MTAAQNRHDRSGGCAAHAGQHQRERRSGAPLGRVVPGVRFREDERRGRLLAALSSVPALAAADLAAMAVGVVLLQAWVLRFPPSVPLEAWVSVALRAVLAALLFGLLQLVLGGYGRSAGASLARRVLRAALVAALLGGIMHFAQALGGGGALAMPPSTALAAWAFLAALATRYAAGLLAVWRPRSLAHGKRVLVVGDNERAEALVRTLRASGGRPVKVLGYVDPKRREDAPLARGQVRRVADFDGLGDYLRRWVVDEVVISLPLRSMRRDAEQVLEWCMEQGVRVSLLDEAERAAAPGATNGRGGPATSLVYAGTRNYGQTLGKRIMDLGLCIPIMLLAAPVALAAMAAVKLTSEGPVFYIQHRIGLNKRLFRFYKFRTMIVNAQAAQKELEHLNEVDGGAFKMRNDPRVTPVGRFLRRYSIDELPQLFNVLRGDMSLVGPRPLPVRDMRRMSEDWARRRFSVLPGLTCLWQVGGRLEIPFDEWMRMDLEYIDNWSLGLDVRILLRTIPAVLSGRGAY